MARLDRGVRVPLSRNLKPSRAASPPRRGPRAWVVGLLGLVTGAVAGCTGDRPEPPSGVLSVSVEQTSAWVRNFNPLLPAGSARWPTRDGIYEPMMIFNGATDRWVPWLALGASWSPGLQIVRLDLRPGVTWSDGVPFTSADVVFTFELLKRHRVFDSNYVWGFLEDVRAVDEHTVQVRFSRVYVPGFDSVAQQAIVPKHVWEGVADPMTFTNPTPVGTGPFTEVNVFRNQVYELGRNPRYWQPGKPALRALRFLAFPSNDQANLALIEGAVDWGANFVPAIERTFVGRDPENNHYWFPLLGSTVFLYANTAHRPFGDVAVRKALSMAIDREKLVQVAMYGYTRPADATGLSDAFASWRDPASEQRNWMRHDLAAANALLDGAGYARGEDGVRRAPGGAPLHFDLQVVAGWSDWVRAGQVIARALKEIGVEVRLRLYDMSAWIDHVQRGDFDLAIAWSGEGSTPYKFYRWLMATETVTPLGTLAPSNWHRFGDPRADELLHAFERTDDRQEQRRIMREVEGRFADLAPAIPLFPSPQWGAYRTRRFEGFPSAAAPYAKLTPNAGIDGAESLLVLVELKPKEK
jgi:peptide/nickel transport system substrate-binding protein